MRVSRAALRLLDEQLGRNAAKLVLRLADGGERQRALLGELDVVVTHDRDIVWNPDTAPDQAADDTQREQIVAAYDTRRGRVLANQEIGRLAALSGGAKRPDLDDLTGLLRQVTTSECPSHASQTIAIRGDRQRRGDECEPTMPQVEEVIGGRFAAADVIDAR